MSKIKLPKLNVQRLPEVCAFQIADDALSRWKSGIQSSDSGDNKIEILDVIGEDFFGEGITARRVTAALRRIGDRDVVVDINSPGGDFFEGIAIYNVLRAHPARVTIRVLGLAASAASLIAMAGDDIEIGKTAFMMVHNAWAVVIGNRHDLAAAIETVAPFDDAMAIAYSGRPGVEKPDAVEWMDNETWFNGEQAIAAGLATGLLPADVASENNTKAPAGQGPTALRRMDNAMAKSGISRSERRALLGEVTGGMQDAATTGTQDAAEIHALLEGLRKSMAT